MTNNHYLKAEEIAVKPQTNSNNIMIIAILYCTFLILSNLVSAKIVDIAGYNITAALIFFPATYIFDDILTEVYGFKVSRRVIWMGLIANAIITFGALLAISLPAASFWPNQQAYQIVFTASLRIFLASSAAYLCGEFINSILLAKLKILTSGKYLWLRVISSTATGVGLDTLIFSIAAFAGTMPAKILFQLFLVMYIFKVSYEIIALPLTYRITRYLKQIDNIDYYDTKTKFNPFSLEL